MHRGKFVGFDRLPSPFHRPSIGVRSPLLSPLLSPSIALPSAYPLSPLYPLPLEGPQRRLRWDCAAGPPQREQGQKTAPADTRKHRAHTKTDATEKFTS